MDEREFKGDSLNHKEKFSQIDFTIEEKEILVEVVKIEAVQIDDHHRVICTLIRIVADQRFERLKPRLVGHLRTLADPVAEIDIGKAEGPRTFDMPQDHECAGTGRRAVGGKKLIDARQTIAEPIGQGDRFKPIVGAAEFDDPGFGTFLRSKKAWKSSAARVIENSVDEFGTLTIEAWRPWALFIAVYFLSLLLLGPGHSTPPAPTSPPSPLSLGSPAPASCCTCRTWCLRCWA